MNNTQLYWVGLIVNLVVSVIFHHHQITSTSSFKLRDETSTFNWFFSANVFDVYILLMFTLYFQYLIESEAGTGANWRKQLILNFCWSVLTIYTTRENIRSVLKVFIVSKFFDFFLFNIVTTFDDNFPLNPSGPIFPQFPLLFGCFPSFVSVS